MGSGPEVTGTLPTWQKPQAWEGKGTFPTSSEHPWKKRASRKSRMEGAKDIHLGKQVNSHFRLWERRKYFSSKNSFDHNILLKNLRQLPTAYGPNATTWPWRLPRLAPPLFSATSAPPRVGPTGQVTAAFYCMLLPQERPFSPSHTEILSSLKSYVSFVRSPPPPPKIAQAEANSPPLNSLVAPFIFCMVLIPAHEPPLL